jgi:YidC/Oxa1 family membrane protein insertase
VNPFTVLAPPLGQMLTWLYDIWPNNYGVAIMILTLMVSLLLFPLTLKQTRSMKAMQEIQPEVKKLQKELKGDREELNKQMMALYQERGVNPAAGCLPLILQMPIWFALYRVFRVKPSEADPTVLDPTNIIPADSPLAKALLADDSSISFLGLDMLQSPSQAMSEGLSVAIPAVLLVLLIIATSYYQVYQTTQRNKSNGDQSENKQAQQMQMISKIMPLFMGFISWTFPMGLGLYFAVSNGFRVAQQAVIFRLDSDDDDGKDGKPVKGEGAPPEQPGSSGPSPHASKKRNRRRRK